jgi:hypothetical protein
MPSGRLIIVAAICFFLSLYYLIFKKNLMTGENVELYKIMLYGLFVASSIILLWAGMAYLISIFTD